MNTLFWAIISLMTLAALLLVLLPLFPYLRKSDRDETKLNATIILVMAMVLPLAAISLYLHYGSSAQLFQYWALKKQAGLIKQELAKLKDPQQIIDRLEKHLQQHPQSYKGWYLLGRLDLRSKNYAKAEVELANAFQGESENNEYAVAYAQALYFANNNRLSEKSLKIVQSVLNRDPKNGAARNLIAMAAYSNKDYQKAIYYWQKMLPLFPKNSQDNRLLLSMIANAQKKISAQSLASPDINNDSIKGENNGRDRR